MANSINALKINKWHVHRPGLPSPIVTAVLFKISCIVGAGAACRKAINAHIALYGMAADVGVHRAACVPTIIVA